MRTKPMSDGRATVYLSLGSNLGDRIAMLSTAVASLGLVADIQVLRVSPVYESEAWGLTEQPKFLNIVVEIETALAPLELLHAVKALEQRLGRRPGRRWGPRSIDIDLILWGSVTMHTPELSLPHERFRDRAFVLTPLADLAPEAADPETGLTVAALADRLDASGLARHAESIYS